MRKLGGILLLVLVTVAVAAQQAPSSCSEPKKAQGPVVYAFRVLNTAEMRFQRANQRYAGIEELLNTEETKKLAAAQEVTLGGAGDPLPGYTLRLTVGEGGKSYVITATKNDEPCRYYGATTDERGMIFLVAPIR